ncbi:MAG TPA: DUF308 domain-containing protein [Puia sp.]|jgi:uncharacterized membrane protein HdeD (DUF308 family)|nr:DUF308 domain-containing protein [Puia sp.]
MNVITEIRQVVRYWWLFIVLGCALIVLGLGVMNQPVATFAGLSIIFECVFIVNGLLEIAFAISNYRSVHGWGWHLAGGILDLVIGALLIVNPVITAVALPYFVGFWLLFRSIAIIGRCFDLPVIWPERAWMALLGVAGLIFSFMILWDPRLGVFSLVVWTAFAFITIGLFYIFLGLHLRKFGGRTGKH